MIKKDSNPRQITLRIRRTTTLSPLLSRHPFVKGMGSIGISMDNMSSYVPYLRGTDYQDIARDWRIIGMDLKKAMNCFSK